MNGPSNVASVFGDNRGVSSTKQPPDGHYHPSAPKHLKKKDKKTDLNPVYMDPPERNSYQYTIPDVATENMNNNDTSFPNHINSIHHDSSGSSKYNESWSKNDLFINKPSASTNHINHIAKNDDVKTDLHDYTIDEFLMDLENNTEETEETTNGTLATFVQRFREQPPKPRCERLTKQVKNKVKQDVSFWWLKAGENTGTTDTGNSSTLTLTPVYQQKNKNPVTPIGLDDGDNETSKIQHRANQLLELSESTINSSLSSSQSNDKTAYQTKKQQQSFITNKTNVPNLPSIDNYSHVKTKLFGKPRPEEDILYQWRLARKMEMAKIASKTTPFYSRNVLPQNKSSHQLSSINVLTPVPTDKSPTNTSSNLIKRQTCDSCKTEENVSIRSSVDEGDGLLCSVCYEKENIRHQNNMKEQSTCEDSFHDLKIQHGYHNKKKDVVKPSCYCEQSSGNIFDGRCTWNQRHLPPHVHDICDILPCRHNMTHHRLQDLNSSNKQTVRAEHSSPDNIDNIVLKKKHKEIHSGTTTLHTSDLLRVTTSEKSDSAVVKGVSNAKSNTMRKKDADDNRTDHKTKTTPSIQQVISHHLFDGVEMTSSLSSNISSSDEQDLIPILVSTSLANVNQKNSQDLERIPSPVGKIELNLVEEDDEEHNNVNAEITDVEKSHLQTILDSSSDEEFLNDEILCELRKKRKINREKLRNVLRALEMVNN